MVDYVPIDDVNGYTSNSSVVIPAVPQFGVKLSHTELAFTKVGQSKTLVLQNMGWDALNVRGITVVGSGFSVVDTLPEVFRKGDTRYIEVECTSAGSGGIYFDVGDSYGDKFVKITATIDGIEE